MNLVKTVMLPVGLAVAIGLSAVPAVSVALKGGGPTEGSCGLGKTTAHEAIADPTKPGATEDSRESPQSVGCTGKG